MTAGLPAVEQPVGAAPRGTWPENRIAFARGLIRGQRLADKPKKHPGIMLAVFAAAATWQIYDLATATETPSRAVLTLQYVLLAGLLLGIASAAFNLMRAE